MHYILGEYKPGKMAAWLIAIPSCLRMADNSRVLSSLPHCLPVLAWPRPSWSIHYFFVNLNFNGETNWPGGHWNWVTCIEGRRGPWTPAVIVQREHWDSVFSCSFNPVSYSSTFPLSYLFFPKPYMQPIGIQLWNL